MIVDVLQVFSIPGVVDADRAQLSGALIAIKTRNMLRAAHQAFPSIPRVENADNLAIVGPDSDFDHYA